MNLWRWLGLCIFFVGMTCLVGTQLPAFGQDKDKKDEKKVEVKVTGKKDDKGEAKKDDKKEAAKKDEKVEAKKDDKKEDKKEEAKKPAGKGGTTLDFTAFNPKNDPFFQEIETKTTQTMKVMGQEVVQKQDQTFYVKWTPGDKTADGNLQVKQQIVGVKMNIDIGGNKIQFDSTDPKQPKNPMTDFFNTLMKQELTFTIKPGTMEVVKIDGRDAFIKNLSETNPAINTLLQTILSEEALKKMAEPTWWALPQQPVSQGETWTRKSELNLGPIGTYNTNFKFTFKGVEGDQAKIDIEPSMTYQAPKDKQGLPFTIKSAKLESKSGEGTAVFNTKKGRFDATKIQMKLGGDLTIEVGNMATEISLDQEQVSAVKTYESNPIAPAAQKK